MSALLLPIAALCLISSPVFSAPLSDADQARLLAAYPDQLKAIEDGQLIWRDGARMPLDDGQGTKAFTEWIDHPDIGDMLAMPYVAGTVAGVPAKDQDPGRARNAAFFDKMYGNCRKGEVEKNLVDVVWLPKKKGQRVRVTKINGVAARLTAISNELDRLPAAFDKYLVPSDGTYACRQIAGTERASAHGYGIAIDISARHSNYWRWAPEGPAGTIVYRNDIPMEIVQVFEKYGFIWGGKWHHYDTMHFEYRPELLMPVAGNANGPADVPAGGPGR